MSRSDSIICILRQLLLMAVSVTADPLTYRSSDISVPLHMRPIFLNVMFYSIFKLNQILFKGVFLYSVCSTEFVMFCCC